MHIMQIDLNAPVSPLVPRSTAQDGEVYSSTSLLAVNRFSEDRVKTSSKVKLKHRLACRQMMNRARAMTFQ